MTRAFVIGNGVSRKDIDLNILKMYGTIYGCNALYREFTPDVLVATDRPIAESIQESGYPHNNKFYTRRPLLNSGALELSKKYRGFSSGPNAVALAAKDGHNKIYLLGFDMGPYKNLFNNIYADTEFYKTSRHPPVFTGNWTKQLKEITEDFVSQQFIRVCGPTTARIDLLNHCKNLEHLELDTFLNRINNGKDL